MEWNEMLVIGVVGVFVHFLSNNILFDYLVYTKTIRHSPSFSISDSQPGCASFTIAHRK